MGEDIADLTGDSERAHGESGADDSNLADEIAIESLRPELATRKVARDYLQKRIRLVDLQIRHFDEDMQLRRLGERLRIAIQLLFILAGILFVIALGALVWSAARSRSVVVGEFDSPPSLAQEGETGRVVAGAVLDELTRLQAATRSDAAKRNLANAWTGDIKIDIPDTGISVGELQRTLREHLGSDIHIGGSVVQATGGELALTVRGDGVLPKTFKSKSADLAELARQAAEYIYGVAEPVLYAGYLEDAGRLKDSEKFLIEIYPRAKDEERPDLANEWGNVLDAENRVAESAKKFRLAITLRPHFWRAWGNLIGSLSTSPGEEAAYLAGVEMRSRAKQSSSSDQPKTDDYINWDPLVQDWEDVRRGGIWESQQNHGSGISTSPVAPLLADASAMLHDWQAVMKYQAASDPADPEVKAKAPLLTAYRALEHDDYGAAIPPLEAFYKQWLNDADLQYVDNDQPCFLGLAYGMTGRFADAEAVFKRTGHWVRCDGMRADAIDHSGDWRNAVAAYRSAIALAPDLPYAYDRWGLALERHGDLKGAAAAFRESSKRGPHWAEPLKHWGDVLMREHQAERAVDKYDEALKFAPEWDALKAARTAAAR